MLVRVRIAAPPQVPRNQGYLLSTSELLFLAGASAWMAGTRHTRGELSRFLLTRGLWLIFLELTVITFAWYFTSELAIGLVVQVIWAIGASMLVFATLIHLPRLAIAGFGAALVLGHNLLDGLAPERFGAPAPLWRVLHVPGPLEIVFAQDSRAGRHLALGGAALIAAFVLLRALDGYGDHARRLHEGGTTLLLMSFPNTTKYPPSLLYLLNDHRPRPGHAGSVPARSGACRDVLVTFGRVPFLFYVTHLYPIHALAVAAGVAQGFPASAIRDVFLRLPDAYGLGLPVVYAVWLGVVGGLVVLSLSIETLWYGRGRDRS